MNCLESRFPRKQIVTYRMFIREMISVEAPLRELGKPDEQRDDLNLDMVAVRLQVLP